MASIGAGAIALSLPAVAAQPRIASRRPPRLRSGDTVGLVKPAGFLADDFDLKLTVEAITAMGLKPKLAPHLSDRFGYLAGKDRDRASDLNAMFADESVRAIFAVRGGWGSARILPFLDWNLIRRNPKLLIGFSDITALHMAIATRAGFPTIHGPNAGSSWGKLSYAAFRELAFDGALPTYRNPPGDDDRLVQKKWRTRTIRAGKASGRLLGGNLTVLSSLVGTPYLPDFTGAILFIEDVDEAEYRIDRMLTQLGLAGILGKLAGVVFGQCTECQGEGPSYGGFTLGEVLRQHIEPLGIPAYQGALFGHIDDQFSLPVGCRAEIDAEQGTIRLVESPVA
ncbi:LD-carboxypeptidase [Sphingomonas swuensis]|uniref:LD-carboxypeptidase n=1 Tax=Sphingomonas swuensis TaxID=977800 RepID=A0ABP7SU48_9SPHN